MGRSVVPRLRKRGFQIIFPLQFLVFEQRFGAGVSSTSGCEYVLRCCPPFRTCSLTYTDSLCLRLRALLKKGGDTGFVFRGSERKRRIESKGLTKAYGSLNYRIRIVFVSYRIWR